MVSAGSLVSTQGLKCRAHRSVSSSTQTKAMALMTVKQAQAPNDKAERREAERETFTAFEQVLAARVGPLATFAEIEAAGLRFAEELCRKHLQAVRDGK